MIFKTPLSRLLLLILACLTSTAMLKADDGESKLGTPITSLPCTISSSGIYTVQANLTTAIPNGIAILIQADNVTLELNGHSVSNTSSSNAAVGIDSTDHKNITVHNGGIRGFLIGVALTSSVSNGSLSYGNIVDEIAVSGATWYGISVYGSGNIINNCQVSNTGGSAIGDGNGYGILAEAGSGNRVIDNDVMGVQATNSSHEAFGICVLQSTDTFVEGNRVSQAQYGVYYDGGSSGKYRDNLVGPSVTSPFSGGTDAFANGVTGDENGNGIADAWELQYFGNLIHMDPYEDYDGDGLSNLQEYQNGTNPTDYYNGIAPTVQITGGNNQRAMRGVVLPQPLTSLVTQNGSGTPYNDAPVTFQITSGGMLVGASSAGPWGQSCDVRTNAQGDATVYCQIPANTFYSVLSTIKVTAGTATPVFFEECMLGAMAAGLDHSLAVDASGAVWSWGNNYNGQLGNGTTGNPSVTSQVSGLPAGQKALAVAAGDSHSLALLSNGITSQNTVWSWGYNYQGQLGNNQTYSQLSQSTVPVQVLTAGSGSTPVPLTGIVAIAAGSEHSLALRSDGTVWAWGSNSSGALGADPSTVSLSTLAVQVPGLSNMTAVAGGYFCSMALRNDHTAWGWGNDYYGQLGIGPSGNTSVPTEVVLNNNNVLSYPMDIVAVAMGGEATHTLLLESGGTVLSMGTGYDGQLGNNHSSSPYPLAVQGFNGNGTLNGVVGIAVGEYHSLAVLGGGTVYAWGENSSGQLGINTTTNSPYPVVVAAASGPGSLGGVSTASAGGNHSLACMNYEGVPVFLGWGDNAFNGSDGGYAPLGGGGYPTYYTVPTIVQLPIDSDNDGLPDWLEYLTGTNPLNPDTNGDGIMDGAEYYAGFNPALTSNDPLSLSAAKNLGISALDYYSPTGGQPPANTPGAPVITLSSPTGATLQ